MVDSTPTTRPMDLKDSWRDTLEKLRLLGGQAVGLKQIAEQRGVTKQAVSGLVPKLEDKGLIQVEGQEKPYLYKLTGKGYRAVDSSPYGQGSVDSSSEESGGKAVRRLHGLTVRVKSVDSEVLPGEWMGRMREEERVNFAKAQGPNSYGVWTNRFFLRLHKDGATVQVREGVDYSTDSDVEAFLRFHEDLMDLLQWVERASGVEMKTDLVDLRRAELAFEDHHLAQLVDRVPGLNLSDFVVEDEDLGKEVVALDDSFGPELETKSGERAEEIGSVVEQELRQYAENPGAVQARHGFENELLTQGLNGQEAVHKLRKVSELEQGQEAVSSELDEMKRKQEQLLELKSEERKTRESLQELVRSNQRTVEGQQKLLEGLVERLHQVESQVSEEDRDLVGETVEDVLEDPEFSEPGLMYGHLMVWKDGEKCVKLLDKSVVEKSDSKYLELIDTWKP